MKIGYIDSERRMRGMTIEDLRTTNNVTGFRGVSMDDNPTKPFRFWKSGSRNDARKSIRYATAEEAAEARVQYLTTGEVGDARQSYTEPEYDVTDPTTGRKIKPKGEPVKQRKVREDAPTATYIVAFVNTADHPTRPGIVERVKVGTTITKNRSTYGLTLGLDVKECVPPEIHPDRLTAETRALVLEAALDADTMFVRVARECFAPTFSLTYDELVSWVEEALAPSDPE